MGVGCHAERDPALREKPLVLTPAEPDPAPRDIRR